LLGALLPKELIDRTWYQYVLFLLRFLFVKVVVVADATVVTVDHGPAGPAVLLRILKPVIGPPVALFVQVIVIVL